MCAQETHSTATMAVYLCNRSFRWRDMSTDSVVFLGQFIAKCASGDMEAETALSLFFQRKVQLCRMFVTGARAAKAPFLLGRENESLPISQPETVA